MTSEELASLRERHYRRLPELKVKTEEEALGYIGECGFLLLFAVAGLELPDLHQASTRPGEDWPWGCWQWKETLPGGKKCAYGKYLRHKGTFISWELFPYFLAAYGSPNGYIQDYREGRLTPVEREILEIL
ncbi:MAG TPA: hypothetical protein VJ565_00665, partial [Dehalococcoidia bacterium]|nr:hypothetical protein [Dehalococcoidia bacterium]